MHETSLRAPSFTTFRPECPRQYSGSVVLRLAPRDLTGAPPVAGLEWHHADGTLPKFSDSHLRKRSVQQAIRDFAELVQSRANSLEGQQACHVYVTQELVSDMKDRLEGSQLADALTSLDLCNLASMHPWHI